MEATLDVELWTAVAEDNFIMVKHYLEKVSKVHKQDTFYHFRIIVLIIGLFAWFGSEIGEECLV